MSEAGRKEEGFLGRWSRMKSDSREPDVQPPVESASAVPAASPDEPPPELPPVETLTMESDFTGFLNPKVDENLRRSALRKLFSDPHFNVMDGLDTYIDDYSVSEPLPAEMLANLKQAQRILRWADGHDDLESVHEPEQSSEAGADEDPVAPVALESETPAEGAADRHDSAEPALHPVGKPD